VVSADGCAKGGEGGGVGCFIFFPLRVCEYLVCVCWGGGARLLLFVF
jgi:hypothetical protein